MCDVHLIETSRTACSAPAGQHCSYCGERLGDECVIVDGHLDDGSPGLYRFHYHTDCAWDVEHDDEAIDANDGCFDYGTPLVLHVPGEGTPSAGARPDPERRAFPGGRGRHAMSGWKLKRTAQCGKCPWRVDVDPHDIPNGYCADKHAALASTIAAPGALPALDAPLHVMACHETDDAHCVGWLHHQLGRGNNIALRLRMRSCTNAGALRLHGAQHPTFEATLPRGASPAPMADDGAICGAD